ncbi:tetratricopeptide repeat-containing sensor histidine kinase [Pseudofulvibacter geojedonensis]|uniref:Histidine kinase n=1 Tax=Pseudofulvibacter geojedonensis TaxID=1123758 RepID=A0ABW3I1Z7_9FLAO
MKNIIYILFILFTCSVIAQNKGYDNNSNATSTIIKGEVIMKETNDPFSGVRVEIIGKGITQTSLSGDFKIQAQVGDELIISHPEIETVRYIIKDSNDKLRIYVEEEEAKEELSNRKKKSLEGNQFIGFINSANKVYKQDASKGIQLVTKSLENIQGLNDVQLALAFKTLGDIYLHWKQFDLAISNYQSSLDKQKNIEVELNLAKSYFKNQEYIKAIREYNNIDKKKLSNWQQIAVYEDLGDIYAIQKKYNKAQESYNKGLTIAKKHLVRPKITDLNSKLGEVSFLDGDVQQANTYFDNSLNLAADENVQRAAIEKERVADFYNSNQQFDEEIELRKKNLSELESIEEDVLLENKQFELDSLTTQRTKYKIGNAYVQQSKFSEAIPYLKESISDANKKEDLVVEKDATRKLSEVYKTVGDYTKALETYQSYVELVDKIYLKRDQEISHAAKFGKDLVKKQQRINLLEKERELSESKLALATKDSEYRNRQQQFLIYGLAGGLLLLSLLAFYMYRNIKQQKLNNNLLALKSLRSQMNPHFIFNALNSVNSFIALNDERTANRYLSDFSKLMRNVLENSEEDFIPLSKEIELIKLYTQLEHFRFQDKFEYNIIVDEDIAIDNYVIPPMLLQPYIENSVWHGLRYKDEKGQLTIHFKSVTDNTIQICIEDNGIGRKKSKELKTHNQKKQKSKGMGNIKQRIAILNDMYQDKVDVVIEDLNDDAGTKVIVTLKKD